MRKLIFLFVALFIAANSIFSQTITLAYDNGTYTGWTEYTATHEFAVRMSPSGPCEMVSIKFYMKKEGAAEGSYLGLIYEWEGEEPSETSIFEQGSLFIVGEGWKILTVPPIDIDGDFVVAWKPLDPSALLAFDDSLQTGRNWILDITDTVWSEVTEHSYLIRAAVQYPTGETEELEGVPINVYPNPASGSFKITLPEHPTYDEIRVVNNMGQLVFSQQIQETEKDIKINPIQNWPKGIYFIHLSGEGVNTTKKIIFE